LDTAPPTRRARKRVLYSMVQVGVLPPRCEEVPRIWASEGMGNQNRIELRFPGVETYMPFQAHPRA
jgi:hypothetical protein